MKRYFASFAALLTAVLLACGCSQVTDELPDSYYETDTDVISEAKTLPSDTAPTTTTTTTTTDTSVSSDTSIYISAVSLPDEPSDTSAETTSALETTISETVTNVSERESSAETTAKSETEFVPETLPTQAVQTAPQITVVTIPTAAETSAAAQTQTEAYYPQSGYYPLNFSRQKGMWVSYLEFDRIMRGASEAEFTDALKRLL